MLRCLIQRNYGYPVVRKVEAAKKLLSTEWDAPIQIHKEAIQISEHMGRSEFTEIIQAVLDDMFDSLTEAEEAAGIGPDEIDLVLTTGGTSLIPAVRTRLIDRYGETKLKHRDTFTSVAAGLAVVAQFA